MSQKEKAQILAMSLQCLRIHARNDVSAQLWREFKNARAANKEPYIRHDDFHNNYKDQVELERRTDELYNKLAKPLLDRLEEI